MRFLCYNERGPKNSVSLGKNAVSGDKSRCGEMADATDLKSVFAKAKCGFESRHRHPLKYRCSRFARARTVPSGILMFRAISRGRMPEAKAVLICSQVTADN